MRRIYISLVILAGGMLAPSQQRFDVSIPNPERIAAAQQCENWCWAAGAEMLLKSQGVDVRQDELVRRVYGSPACAPSFGRFDPILKAVSGTYDLPDGSRVEVSGAYHYGIPTDVNGMINSIRTGRPFLLAWKGHIHVVYGISGVSVSYGRTTRAQIQELKLIDPLYGFGLPEFTSFVVNRDSFADINGTFELLTRLVSTATGKARTLQPSASTAGLPLDAAINKMVDALQQNFETVIGPGNVSSVVISYEGNPLECQVVSDNGRRHCTYSFPINDEQKAVEEFNRIKALITAAVPKWNPRPDKYQDKLKKGTYVYFWSMQPGELPANVALMANAVLNHRLLLVFGTEPADKPSASALPKSN